MLPETLAWLQPRLPSTPRLGIVLGSGLGSFTDELQDAVTIPYADIPHFPLSTAIGHAGTLVVGHLAGVPVAAMSGRFHLYEGYTPQQSTYGIRVLARLGVRSLVLTNAAGGINTEFGRGTLVLVRDHINLQGVNPLVGPNDDALGPRFPDMTEAYSRDCRDLAQQVARELNFRLPEGVYAGLLGPSYETPAEIRYLRAIGADLVGMSTVAETIVASHMGLRVLAISCVTNAAAGILPVRLDHAEVLEATRMVHDRFTALLRALIPRLEA